MSKPETKSKNTQAKRGSGPVRAGISQPPADEPGYTTQEITMFNNCFSHYKIEENNSENCAQCRQSQERAKAHAAACEETRKKNENAFVEDTTNLLAGHAAAREMDYDPALARQQSGPGRIETESHWYEQ